jgi:streptogramin lyase
MTDRRDPMVMAAIVELAEASPAAPSYDELDRIFGEPVGSGPVRPLGRPRSQRRQWVTAAVAALAVLVLVGAAAWLLRGGPENDVVDPTPTTAILGPGSWSVAATFPEGAVSAEQLTDTAALVRTWQGVIEATEVAGESAWRQLTGLESDCGAGDVAPPCGPGVVVLTINSSMAETAIRLEREFGMTALTPIDVPRDFVEGYLDAAIDSASPVSLAFDPSSLGVEQPLDGPFRDWDPDASVCSGPCDVGVAIDVDGVVASAGIAVTDRDSVVSLEFSGGLVSVENFLIDRVGRGGVLAELRSVIERRRVYQFAGLPIAAAVVTFEQADGSTVWQRPLGGMALILDAPGSGGAKEFSDEEPEISESLRMESQDAGPFVVLDATGTEIMRIQDTPDGPFIDDLRKARAPTVEADVNVAGLEITDVINVDMPDPLNTRIVGAGNAIWVATGDSIIRIDAASREVTDGVPPSGRTVDLVAVEDAVWVSTAPSDSGAALPPWEQRGNRVGTIVRIDAATRQITDTFEVPDVGRLRITDDALWVSHWAGFDRIDLNTLSVDTLAYPEGNQVRGTREWLGESDNVLWLLDDRAHQSLTRIDLATRQTEHYGVAFDPSPEMSGVLADDAIWFIDWGDDEVARFDVESRELTYLPGLGADGRFVPTDGAVWAPSRGNTITRIDTSTHEVTDVIAVEPGPRGLIAADGQSLWVVHASAVSRIDIATRQVTHLVDLGSEVWHLLAFDEAIWVVGEDTIRRIEYP